MIYHENLNEDLMGKKNAIQSKGAITINVFVSVKNVIYVKKIVFGILLLVVPKMKNIQQVFMNDSVITREEIADTEPNPNDTVTKKVSSKF